MADNKAPASDNTRNSATEDLFNREATARINPNRKITDDIFGRDQLGSEELFKQNIQGRIDHEVNDQFLPDIASEGFNFQLNPQVFDALTSNGTLSAGTELATLNVPVEGGDFSFALDDSQFRIDGDRLVLNSDLSLRAGTDFQLTVQVSSNSSAFSIDVPVTVNFDNLAGLVEEVINQAPVDIELSAYDLDETATAGDVVATITAIDNDNVAGFTYELTGEGADKFEIVGNQLVIKDGVTFDFETQSQHTVEITVTDPSGNQLTEQVVIDLNDINEAPLLSDEVFGVTEGAAVTAGTLDAVDQDLNDQLTFSVADGFALPPGFALESDGDYSFDPAHPAYDHLAVGDSQVLTIPVRVVDAGGLESNAQIQLTIQGTNDAPVADANIVAAVAEGASQISGQLVATDADDGASLSFSITEGATAPAGFTLNADGSYSFDPQDSAYETMDAGDTQVLTIPVTVTDDQGATDTQQIRITVTGTNDAPVAGADATASVDEGDAAISGQLTASDVDDAASLSFSITSGSSAPAGFILNSDGSYSFDPQDSAYDAMDAGDTQVLTIPVTVTDDQGATDTQQIRITVTGTNDAPVAGADATASVDEGDAAISGQLTASDVDDAASLSFSITSGSSAPAGFTLNSDGSYSFDPQDSAYEAMDAGDTQVLTIPVTVTDDQGATDTQQIRITVTGTNDEPVAGADATASVDEGDAAISGQLTASDVDDSASLSFSITSGSSAPAGFALNSDGSYSFDPQDSAYEAMDAGDTQVLTIPVTVTDDQGATDTQQIKITVTGTNDAPVAGADATASVNEGDAAISGQLTASDVDDSANLSFSITSGSSAPAGFTLNSDGSYSFDPQDSAYETMDAGDTQVLTIPVTVTDDQGATDTQQIRITVTGTNDTPVAGADATASVDEGDAAISGQLTASDVDDSASLSFSITSGSSAPAGFTLNADGSYSFDPQDSAYEAMDAGDTQVLTIPVTVTDDQGATDTQQIRITVTGTNDAPVAGADATASVDEGDAAISGQLTASDVDDSASLSFSITSGSSAPAGFTLNADGSYSFDPQDSAYDAMDAGDTQVLTIPVTVTDDQGATDTQQIRITVTGTNDAPVAGADVTASVDEGDSAISGQLTASDVDGSASLSFSITSGSSAPAGFTLNADGSYSFDPQDSAYEAMDAGDTQVLTIPVTVTDDQGATDTQQIRITVTGTNDAPVAGADATASVDEGAAAISGQLTASDVDDSASLSFSITSGSSAPAGFTLNSDGSYSFDPQDSAYEAMDAGDTQVLTIPVTVTDDQGATDTQQIRITVTGTNDAPVAGADATASVDEGDAAISGQLTASDVDDSASLSFSITSGSSAPAGFTLNSDGSYSFDPQDSAYEAMDAGDTQVLTIPVTVTDDQGATDTQQIRITVTGTNDAPVAGADATASVDEGDSTISGQLTASDVDDSASLSFSITSGSSAPAGFTLNSDGSYSFDPQDSAYESMDAGDTQVLTIPVTVTDDQGATDTQQIRITVTGTNDAPVAGADATASVDEGDSTISGQLTASDVDDSASLSFSITSGSSAPAGFTLNSDGSYSFDPQDSAYESMDAGDTQVLTIPVTVTDDQGATDTQQIKITVTGTNDTPTVVSISNSAVTENAAGATIGNLSTTDADSSDTHTYTVSDSRFEVVTDGSGNQQLKLKDGVALDSEAEGGSVSVTVTSTDSAGASVSEAFTINVADINDGPTDISLSANSITENATGAVVGNLNTTDDDGGDSHTYTLSDSRFEVVTDGSGNQQLKLKDGVALDSEAEGGSVSVTVTSTDSAGASVSEAFTVNVADINDGPTDISLSANNITENATGAVVGNLNTTDDDSGDSHTYTLSDSRFEVVTDGSGNQQLKLKDGVALDSEAEGGSVSVTVTSTDSAGASVSEAFTINVADINDGPTDISLSANNITENATGAVVGNLNTTDDDSGDSHTYTLSDNRFEVVTDGSGNQQLKLKDGVALDSEAEGGSVTVTVTSTDSAGASVSEAFTINVADINDGPTDISLSANNITENATGAVVGNLNTTDDDSGDSHSYTLSDSRFEVVTDGSGNQQLKLKDGVALDSEAEGGSVSVTVTSTDSAGASVSEAFTINVADINDGPTDISLSANNITENATGAVVGNLNTTDDDSGDSHSYTLSDSRFEVVTDGSGNQQLKLKDGVALDSEAEGGSVSVTVTSTDSAGASVSEAFTVNVADINDGPTDISLSANNITENATGAVVGNLNTTDDDSGDSHSYALSDNRFEVVTDGSGNQQLKLKDGVALDSEAEGGSVSVTVTSTDSAGASVSEAFTINVADINDGPTDISLSSSSVNENAAGAVVGNLSTTDQDSADTHSYTVSDSRFEIVDDGSGNQQLKLKAGIALDHESDDNLSVTVTTDDGNGGSYSENFTITVDDGNDTPTDISVSGSSRTVAITNAGFESANLADNGAVTGSPDGWTLTANRGGTWDPRDSIVDVPEGENVAFIDQAGGTLSQTLSESLSADVDLNLSVKVSAYDAGGTPAGYEVKLFVGNTLLKSVDESDFALQNSQFTDVSLSLSAQELEAFADQYGEALRIELVADNTGDNVYFDDVKLEVATYSNTGGVDENSAGAVVGNLQTEDQDSADSHSYTVSDSRFEVVDDGNGNKQLKLKDGVALDSEAESGPVSVTVTSTDSAGASVSEAITINVTDINEGPTDIQLSANSVSENAAGAVVGNLTTADQDVGDSHTYTVSDNRFEVATDSDGNQQLKLKSGVSLDNEAEGGSLSVAVMTTDSSGASYTESFNINVADVNENPHDINLTGAGNDLVGQDFVATGTSHLSISDRGLETSSNVFTMSFTTDSDVSTGQTLFETGGSYAGVNIAIVNGEVRVYAGRSNAPVVTTQVDGDTSYNLALELDKSGRTVKLLLSDSHDFSEMNESNSLVGSQANWQAGDWDLGGDFGVGRVGVNAKGGVGGNFKGSIDSEGVNVYANEDLDGALQASTGIIENVDGAAIGTLTVSDQDVGDTHTYTVTDNRFEVVADVNGNPQLKLKDGVSLDHEAEGGAINVTVVAHDGNGGSYSESFNVSIADVNDRPVDISLSSDSVSENAAGAVVGNLSTTDDDSGNSHTYSVADSRFEIVDDGSGNKQLKLKAGVQLDHEAEGGSVNVAVTTTDNHGASYTENLTVAITDVNEAVTGIQVSNQQSVQESLEYGPDYYWHAHSNPVGKVVAELQAVDTDSSDTHTYSIVSATDQNGSPVTVDASFPFEIQGNKVVVKSSATLDYETTPKYNVVVQAEDAAGHTATETVTVDITDYETYYGGISSDQVARGSSEEDTMRAGGGNDSLSGRAGDDRLEGETGNDMLTGGEGNDYLDGGANWDTAVYSGNRADYTVTHNGGSSYTITDNRAGSPDGTDTVVNVENFRFADGDVTKGSILNLAPEAGADISQTVAEDSSVVNGQLQATDANGDTLTYSITSGSAPDGFTLNSDGSYSFDPGNAAYNQLAAGETQTLTIPVTVADGHGGSDTQNIQITVQGTSDVNAPSLVVSLGAGQRSVTDDTSDQTINGTSSNDGLVGGSGNDTINLGTDGEDYAQGGAGDDTITGANSSSDSTDDRIDGGAGNDTLISSNASGDLLIGGAGNDTAHGNGGNDLYVMEIGGGQDTFHGGSGMDQVLLMGPDGQITDINDITITMTSGSYSVNNGVAEFSSGATGTITLSDGSSLSFDGVEKLQFNEHFQYDDNWENVFVAQSNGDTITGNVSGDGNYFGSVGNDTITGMSNEDYVSAGAGDDVINTGADEDIVVAGSGNDTVNTGSENDMLIGGAGDDTMDGGSGTDTAVFDGNRDQYMVTRNSDGSYQVKDLVVGRDGTDTIANVERFQFADQTVNSGSLLSTNPSNSQAVGSETVFDLDISASMIGADASDSLSAITVTGLPDGVTLSNGTENADGSWTVEEYELDGLSVRVPDSVTADFSLNVSATAADSSANEQAVSMQAVQIELPDTHGGSSSSATSSFTPQNATLLGEENFDSGTPAGRAGPISSVTDGQVGAAADINDASFDMSGLSLNSSNGAKTTVTMWVQADPDGSWEVLAGSDKYSLAMNNGNLGFNTWNYDLYGVDASAIDDGQMHQIVAVFTNGDVTQNEIYIDGVQQNLTQIQGSQRTSNANIDSDNGELHIGRAGADNPGRYDFTGQMDEVKVFDGELSQSDVSDLYSLESQGKEWDTPAPTPAPAADAGTPVAAEPNVMQGSDGNDQLTGGDGADKLLGGEGNDSLIGGAGDDILQGGKGDDIATGGAGSDTYVFNPFDGNDSFSGGTGGGWTDTIQLGTDGSADPGDPWTITVNGQELDYDLAAQALELNPDTSGVVTMADGSELTFEGIEKIEW